jgi:gamma-glutamyltranspeptidase/glutathione hydrolase/leukotriene-C4 hydrolase
MTVRLPPRPGSKSEVYGIDFRETAPALSNKTMFVHDPISARFGGMSVAVPGEVRGLQEAYHRWGSLPWKRLVDPSAKLAAGWEVDKELWKRIQVSAFLLLRLEALTSDQLYADLILSDPDWSLFAPDGKLLREGEVIRRLNLSRTLSVIADEGPSAFYRVCMRDFIKPT